MSFYDLPGGIAVALYPLGEHLAADVYAGFKLFFQSCQALF